jgi:mono/diheme cytochrome c family protein
MRISGRKVYWATCAVAVVFSFSFLLIQARSSQEGPSSAQQKEKIRLIYSVKGPDLFHAYCASCHGTDGSGAGPVAPALKPKVPDLTTIAQRNGGLFPARRIQQIIAGDELIVSHGSREMPVWGPIFHQIEEDRDLGEVRLQNLTKYLEAIQK